MSRTLGQLHESHCPMGKGGDVCLCHFALPALVNCSHCHWLGFDDKLVAAATAGGGTKRLCPQCHFEIELDTA